MQGVGKEKEGFCSWHFLALLQRLHRLPTQPEVSLKKGKKMKIKQQKCV